MSKYSNTFELVKKHWPIANLDESDLFFMKIVDVCSCANYDENNIEELCSLIGKKIKYNGVEQKIIDTNETEEWVITDKSIPDGIKLLWSNVELLF